MNDSRFQAIRPMIDRIQEQEIAPILLLYITSGCHLCEQAENLIRQQTDLPVTLVEIADDAQLLEQYGVRIPVLHHQGIGGTLDWPFDAAAIRRLLI